MVSLVRRMMMGGEGWKGPLDPHLSGLKAAYGKQVLRSAMIGQPLIRLREDNGSTESDFSISDPDENGNGTFLNSSSQTIADWITATGATNVYLVTWYDQSGDGKNLTQSVAGNQAQWIVASKHADFVGANSNDYHSANVDVTANGQFTQVFRVVNDALGVLYTDRLNGSSSPAGPQFNVLTPSGYRVIIGSTDSSYGSTFFTGAMATRLVTFDDATNAINGYKDDVSNFSSTHAGSMTSNSNQMTLGSQVTVTFWDGQIEALLLFDIVVSSAARTAIHNALSA